MLGLNPTMMITDYSVLRTPAIRPNIRILWDLYSTFMLTSRGGSQGLSPTYEQAHAGLNLFILALYI